MYVTGSFFSEWGVISRWKQSLDSSLHPSLMVFITQVMRCEVVSYRIRNCVGFLLQVICFSWRAMNSGCCLSSIPTWLILLITSWHGPRRKNCFTLLLHCCIRTCWGDHVNTTKPLPSNSHCLKSHSLAKSVAAGFTILPLARCHSMFNTNGK
jgi:hypothetical protein